MYSDEEEEENEEYLHFTYEPSWHMPIIRRTNTRERWGINIRQ